MGAVSPGTGVIGVQCDYSNLSLEDYWRNKFERRLVLLGSLPLTTPLDVPLVAVVPLVWVAILDWSSQ